MLDGNRRIWLKQFAAFCAIGVLNTAIDMIVFALMIWIGVHYAAAQAAAYLAGMTNSYLMNSAITFRGQRADVDPIRRKVRFAVWNAMMLTLSIGLIAVAKEAAGLSELAAKAVVTALIVALNFYGSKKWVFADKRPKEARMNS